MGPPPPRPRPVVLVHGILGQRHLYWNVFRRRLEADGFRVHEAELPYYLLGDMEEAARHLVDEVRTMLRADGAKAADLVCHSAGGLVARRAMRDLGTRVGHLVMMGTANQGTHAAWTVAFLRFARQARPGSEFLESLAADPVDRRRVHSVWSPVDGIVLPGSRAILPGADNVEVPWMGHWMFLWSLSAYNTVRAILETDPFRRPEKPLD